MSETKKLTYIDGLKGTGALIVYLCHFAYAFYFALYSLNPANSHTAGNVEVAIGKTPLNILYNGNFAVQLFFVASGFVLCIRYFQDHDRKRLAKSAAKRYFRLAGPILLVSTVIFFLMKAGLYQNTEAAALAGSTDWFAGFNNFEPGYSHALREALFGCFLFGHNYFNGVLWTVKYLFLGALLVYALAAVCGQWKYRYGVYAILLLVLLRTDYAGLLLGYIFCDLMYTKPDFMKKLAKIPGLWLVTLVLGIYFGSYPSIGTNLEGSMYGFLPVLSVLYHRIGAVLIVLAVLLSERLQRFFGGQDAAGRNEAKASGEDFLLTSHKRKKSGEGLFVRLGKISFSWYLVHFPVIAVFSSAFLLRFYGLMNYHVLMLMNFVLTTVIVWAISAVMTKWVEQPWNRLLNKIWK